jgi:hypothetical protein
MKKIEKLVNKTIKDLKNDKIEFIDLSDDNFFIENDNYLKEKLNIDEYCNFLDLLEEKLESDIEIEKISNKCVKREFYRGQYVYFTEAGYTLIYLLPEKTKIYGKTVKDFNNYFKCDL